ncbi:hypothetical protein CEXT_552581 [Caerostris extrusa]|uniref:Uncharacterized protein n=1 Tax=Caerostris extrusa TaxID=172846 RepID=A0AAV4VS04_CAEEX|nr:hypothetical protein CEXT_552581 [Caerostris extrusa]
MGIYTNEYNHSTKHHGKSACPTRTAPDLSNLLSLFWSCRPHEPSYLAPSVAFASVSFIVLTSVHSLPCGMFLLLSHLANTVAIEFRHLFLTFFVTCKLLLHW